MRKAPLRHDMHLLLGEASFARHMAETPKQASAAKAAEGQSVRPCPPVDICPWKFPLRGGPIHGSKMAVNMSRSVVGRFLPLPLPRPWFTCLVCQP